MNKTRGFYGSPFVPGYEWGYEVVCNGQKHLLGSAEIRVTGASGRVYAAPDLIVHYIKDIGYLPPEEFIQAVEELSRLRTKGIRGDPGP